MCSQFYYHIQTTLMLLVVIKLDWPPYFLNILSKFLDKMDISPLDISNFIMYIFKKIFCLIIFNKAKDKVKYIPLQFSSIPLYICMYNIHGTYNRQITYSSYLIIRFSKEHYHMILKLKKHHNR